jgi:DNA-binding XRE family transcriptional regulator
MTSETTEPARDVGAAQNVLDLPPPKVRRELRKFAGKTQEDVAAECGVTDGAVSYWERRELVRRYRPTYVLLLCRWATEARAKGMPITWPPAVTDTQK